MLKLSEERQGRLAAQVRSPGWDDLMEVMDQLCVLQETKLLRMNRAGGIHDRQILSMQDQCRAWRELQETLQLEVRQQIQALTLAQSARAPQEPSEEELLGIQIAGHSGLPNTETVAQDWEEVT